MAPRRIVGGTGPMLRGARPRWHVGLDRCGVDDAPVVEGGRLRGGVGVPAVVVPPARSVRNMPGRRGRHRLERLRPERRGGPVAGRRCMTRRRDNYRSGRKKHAGLARTSQTGPAPRPSQTQSPRRRRQTASFARDSWLVLPIRASCPGPSFDLTATTAVLVWLLSQSVASTRQGREQVRENSLGGV